MFDVPRSYFKTTLYGINVTCEWLQNSLAPRDPFSMPFAPCAMLYALSSLSLIPGDFSFIGYLRLKILPDTGVR
jgi:hypothetical protein